VADAPKQRGPLSLVLVAILGALLTVLFHPVVGLPVATLGLAGLVYRRSTALALVMVVVAAAITTGLSMQGLYVIGLPLFGVPVTARAPYVFGVFMLVSYLLAGLFTAQLLMRWRPMAVVSTVTLGLSAATIAALAILADGAQMSVWSYVDASVAAMAGLAGIADEQSGLLSGTWPSLVILMSALVALMSMAAATVAAARVGNRVERVVPIARFDLDVRFVALPVVALVLLAASRLPLEASETVAVVATNVVAIARWVFFVQGIAVFAALYERVGLGRGVRMLGYLLLGITEVLLPLVSLTGLADIWLNVRKLPRDGRPAGAVETPPDTE